MSDLIETLKRDFHDSEYRHAYSAEFVDAKIGTQIKVLREQRGWSQEQLAEKAGMKQSRSGPLNQLLRGRNACTAPRVFAEALTDKFKAFGSHIRKSNT
jgi:predicted XRE-type DNA-binding protein